MCNSVNICNTTELYVVKNGKLYSLVWPEVKTKFSSMRITTVPACDFLMRIISMNMCEALRAEPDILKEACDFFALVPAGRGGSGLGRHPLSFHEVTLCL